LSWSGTKYRLHGPIITAKEKTEGNKWTPKQKQT
jgi:hypothetical protein